MRLVLVVFFITLWPLLNRWLCNKTNGNKGKCYKLLLGLLIERGLSTNGLLKRGQWPQIEEEGAFLDYPS